MVDMEPGVSVSGPTWLELLGSDNWENLLDPLNNDLRHLILRCGDFCQSAHDTFISDQYSPYCGASRYAKADVLCKTAFPGGPERYKVVGFLYATARVFMHEAFLIKSWTKEMWDRESNWIGYIVVSSDEASAEIGRREIYVVWRGTNRNYEWVNVLVPKHQTAKSLLREHNQYHSGDYQYEGDDSDDSESDHHHREAKVMRGWLTIYTSDNPKSPFTKLSARTQLLAKIKHLLDKYKNENPSIILTGHSLGATLSVLSAFDIVENLRTEIPVSAIVFGSPKVGNKLFKQRFDAYPNLKVLHVRNSLDVIPHYPPRLLRYVHIGTELEIDTRKSNYLKDSKNPSDWHNLQAMLHVVNGWHGINREFAVMRNRSLALVNKACDFLKDEYLVPPSWWVEKNKGLVLNEDGEWVMTSPDEYPTPEFA